MAMYTMGKRRWRVWLALLLAGGLLVGCSQSGSGAAKVAISFAHMDTLPDLYRATSAIVDAEIVSGPVFTATDVKAAEYPGSGGTREIPLATKYAVYEVVVRSVIQQRPGMTLAASTKTIRVGFNVVNPDLGQPEVGNVEEISGFPRVSDMPSVKSAVTIFVSPPTVLGVLGAGYEALGYGSLAVDNESVTINFVSGVLKGATVLAAELTSAAAVAEYALAKGR